jgi:hypothetical protein
MESIMLTALRLCRTCGKAKPPEAFGPRQSRCRPCDRERLRKLDAKRREKRLNERRLERLCAEPDWRDLDDEQFKAKIDDILAQLEAGAYVDDLMPDWWLTNWPDPDDD